MFTLNHNETIIKQWNEEFPEFPLFNRLLRHISIDSPYLCETASQIIRDKTTFKGMIIIQTDDINPIHATKATLSFIYVMPKYRNKGLGTKLLNHALSTLKAFGIKQLVLGEDMHPLFPGVPEIMDQGFFTAHGFTTTGKAYNLIRHTSFSTLPNIDPYHFALGSEISMESIHAFIAANFSPRWAQECLTAMENGNCEKNYLTIIDDNKIIAFIRLNLEGDHQLMHNINYQANYKRLGGIGPLGTHPEYRHQGLAKAIIQKATTLLFERGATDVLVDWTGLVSFYEKIGFTKVHTFNTYYKTIDRTRS